MAVVGPCAADPRTFMGCYAFPTHVLPRFPGHGLGLEVPSAVDALRAELPDAEVVHAPGCAVERRRPVRVRGRRRRGPRRARCASRSSATSRACSATARPARAATRADLRLPGVQAELLAELVATGTPVVVVVVSGRPYALGDVQGRRPGSCRRSCRARRAAGRSPGCSRAGSSRAGGCRCRSPARAGGQPSTYLQPPLGGAESAGISTLDATPLFPFGYGRSYTTFAVDDLRISAAELPTDGEIAVAVRVRNTGERAGEEVVQLYLHDVLAQVVRPARQLVGFARVPLEPGAAADVRFRLHADRTAFTGRGPAPDRGAGRIEILVGTSAADLPCRDTVRLTGPLREVGADRQLVTPVDVERARRRVEEDNVSTSGARPRHAGHGRRVRRGVRGDRVQGAQRPRRRRRHHPGAGGGPAREARLHRSSQRCPAAQPVVELVFDDELNAYATEIVQGTLDAAAGAGAVVAVAVRGDGVRSGPPARGPASWSPRAAKR